MDYKMNHVIPSTGLHRVSHAHLRTSRNRRGPFKWVHSRDKTTMSRDNPQRFALVWNNEVMDFYCPTKYHFKLANNSRGNALYTYYTVVAVVVYMT